MPKGRFVRPPGNLLFQDRGAATVAFTRAVEIAQVGAGSALKIPKFQERQAEFLAMNRVGPGCFLLTQILLPQADQRFARFGASRPDPSHRR